MEQGAPDDLRARQEAHGCTTPPPPLPSAVATSGPVVASTAWESERCGRIAGWSAVSACTDIVSTCNGERASCRDLKLINERRDPRCAATTNASAFVKEWTPEALNAAGYCGAKTCDWKTAAVVNAYTEGKRRCPAMSADRMKKPSYLVVVDKACNGCGLTIMARQNIWHRMARMFTVWRALKALSCASSDSPDCRYAALLRADIFFTHAAEPIGNSSASGWSALAGAPESLRFLRMKKLQRINWCQYDRLAVVPYSPALREMGRWANPDTERNSDPLWSLAYGKHLKCSGTEASSVWRSFVRDMVLRLELSPMPQSAKYSDGQQSVTACLLLRKAPGKAGVPSVSWVQAERALPRHEANPDEIAEALGSICHGKSPLEVRRVHFNHLDSLQHQVRQMAGCDVALGIHGAQLMNVMWMEPGSALVEFHKPDSKSEQSYSKIHHASMVYYYRNVAHLTGHTYFSRLICESAEHGGLKGRGCAGFTTSQGINLQPQAVRAVGIAAVAAVTQSGGRYDDRPVRPCAAREW